MSANHPELPTIWSFLQLCMVKSQDNVQEWFAEHELVNHVVGLQASTAWSRATGRRNHTSLTPARSLHAGLDGLEPYYRPPYHNLRHPLVFYYAHAAALFVNKLRVAGLLKDGVNAHFEHIFETGVDEMGWDDLSKNDMLWPLVRCCCWGRCFCCCQAPLQERHALAPGALLLLVRCRCC